MRWNKARHALREVVRSATALLLLAVAAIAMPALRADAAAFTPGNIVVVRVGNGGGLTTAAAPVFLEEITPGGILVQTIALPTTVSGSHRRLTLSGTATSEGYMNLSSDGQYFVLGGYDAAVGTASVPSTMGSAVNRVVARVDLNGQIDTTTAINMYSGGNLRSVTSVDGTSFWTGGSNGSVRYVGSLGATTSTQLSTSGTNMRVVTIFDGQLYVSSASNPLSGVNTVGTGLPTTSGQTIALLPGMSSGVAPTFDYFFADSDTLYVTDEGAGIQKWKRTSGTWSLLYNLTPASGGFRGLTGTVSGGIATLWGTSTAGAQNSVVSVTDVLSQTTPSGATFTTVATAGSGTVFRGLRYLPASCSAPTIDQQPQSATACEGGSASFSVAASGGTPPLTYQWRRGTTNLVNGGNISGADTPTLTIDPVTAGDAGGDYNVVIQSSAPCAAFSVTSDNAALTVDTPVLWYPDVDGDLFGDAGSAGALACVAPNPTDVTDNTDCDDTNPAINPGEDEDCNGVDDNCAGGIDEGFPNLDGDALADCVDPDDDGDGVDDGVDNCPAVSNPGQENNDGDGEGDACDPDDDDDGVADGSDNCPLVANADQADSDGDGDGNVCDNCPTVSNPMQLDSDNDGIGDACEPPANDLCANPSPLNDVNAEIFNNSLAGTDGPASCGIARDVWYVYQPATNRTATFQALSLANNGIGLQVFAGTACPATTSLGCATSPAPISNAIVTLQLTGGTTYLVRVGGTATSNGGLALVQVVTAAHGACCTTSGCIETTSASCASMGGTFSGAGSSCEEDNDRDGLGDVCDPDDDNDGLSDEDEAIESTDPFDPDSDDDGVNDGPEVAAGTDPNDTDSDDDGAGDGADNCALIANADQADDDVDDVGNLCDNCPTIVNPDQADADEDGIGDACETQDVQFTIELESVTVDVTRCVTFEFHDSSNQNPTLPAMQVDVAFDNGVAAFTLPIDCGDYDCVRVRDHKHTLARQAPIVSGPGGSCSASFTAIEDNELTGGNLNDDPYIDILDFGAFVGRFGDPLDPSSMCSLTDVHADINGDGVVDGGDYTFIAINFLADADPLCGDVGELAGGGREDGPRTSISVLELFELGLGELVVADLNGDGVLDLDDVTLYLTNGIPGDFAIYIGEAGGRWSDAANWSGGIAPGAQSDVVVTAEVVLDVPGAVAQHVIIIPGGTLRLTDEGGLTCAFVRGYEGGALSLESSAAMLEAGEIVLNGAQPLAWHSGTIIVDDAGEFTLSHAELSVGDGHGVAHGLHGNVNGNFAPALSVLSLRNGAAVHAASGVSIAQDGAIEGHGSLAAAASAPAFAGPVVSGGALMPQEILAIGSDLVLSRASSLHVQLRPDGCDALRVGGAANLDGALQVTLAEGFAPAPGSAFEIIRSGFDGVHGAFAPPQVSLPQAPGVVLSVVYLAHRVLIVCEPAGG
jgi:hypothetical protein